MSKTYLIYNSDFETRLEKIKELLTINFSLENNPDLLIVGRVDEKKSLGIEEVKVLPNFLKIKPLSHHEKVVIIKDSHLLTEPAQNSLLKILEEPPEYSLIFLEAPHINNFLPTTLSRCLQIKVKGIKKCEELNDIKIDHNFFNFSIKQKIEWVVSNSKLEKEEVIKLLHELLILLKEEKNSEKRKRNTEIILEQINNLSNYNINSKIVLDYLALNLVV
jgi:DNA polymerase III subunit delta'